jgi:hypothetical protein
VTPATQPASRPSRAYPIREVSDLRDPAAGDDDLGWLDDLPDPPAGLSEADHLGCRWVEGEPKPLRRGMFCCAPTLPGESCCAKHRKIVWAYRRAARRPEAA